jgi:Domain of unknown function (DUF4055)
MGEIVVKSRGKRYLPKTEGQSDEEYRAYLAGATYYNAASRTVSGLVGSVHSREPIIENRPDTINLASITNDGQSFEMFAKKITKEVVSVGRIGVMIDAPPMGGGAYCVLYMAEDIVDWSSIRTGSREKLNYVVLREFNKPRRPFSSAIANPTEQYRVLFIDEDDGFYKQRVFQTGDLTSMEYQEIVPLKNGVPMTEIPFLFIGVQDFGSDIEKPPILDICLLNLSHYRSYAHLEAGRYYTATPIYTIFLAGGGDNDVQYKVGPNTVWQFAENDKAEILEFVGAGLKHLESALSAKETQMSALGGKMASQPVGMTAETADAVVARERGEASFLGTVIATLNAATSRILSALADWYGTPANVVVQYSSEATNIRLDAREIRAMAGLYETGLMPLETIYTIFRQNNIIPVGVSFADFKVMLPMTAPKVENKIEEAVGRADAQAAAKARYEPAQQPIQDITE